MALSARARALRTSSYVGAGIIGGGVTPPTPGGRAAPYRIAVYGDSFGQRAMDILGSPNSLDSGTVNPVTFRWPSEDTSRVGGVSWGPASWLSVLAGGRYRVPYQLNRAVGGSNSGQINQDGGTSTDRLSVMRSVVLAEIAAGRPVHGLLLHVGTNDAVTAFTALQSYNNIRNVCQQLISAGVGCIVMHTTLPQGNPTFPAGRIDGTTGSRTDPNSATNPAGTAGPGDTRARVLELNAMLVANLKNEVGLVGKVEVVDPFLAFQGPAQAGDVKDGATYDGLHLSAPGCIELIADWIMPAFKRLLPTDVASGLDASTFGALGTFEGSGGTFAGGFTGTLATGWTLTSLTQFANVNVSGSKVASKEGTKQVVTIAGDASNATDNRTVQFELSAPITLPADVAVGDRFEVGIEIEVVNAVGLRHVDLELRVTEPDGTVRTARACQATPSAPATNDAHTIPNHSRVYEVWAPARTRKAGTYGTITLAAVVGLAGKKAAIGGTIKFAKPTIRKALFA